MKKDADDKCEGTGARTRPSANGKATNKGSDVVAVDVFPCGQDGGQEENEVRVGILDYLDSTKMCTRELRM